MTPNQLPPLSDEQIAALKKGPAQSFLEFARAIESATLAALAQQAQEPVAWLYVDTVGERYLCFSRPTGGGAITNLYTTPPAPQPAPVDERDAEIAELRAEVLAWRKQCDRLTHQVICCGVAASHPDATLTTRGAYAGKWNSGQAEEVRKLRAERDALAALSQPAPSPQAPGRRNGPPGITLEPQGHEQPAVPVVSDEQIDALAAGNNYPGTVPGYRRFARAILALRPAVEPMTPFTPSQRMRLWQNTEKGKSATSLGAFERICQTVEAAHRIGITAKAEDAHQPTKEAEKP